MYDDTTFLGALIDDRPHNEKIKDVSFVETVAAADNVEWKEKKNDEWRSFPEQDQKSSGSCVAQTIKRLATISFWLEQNALETFSATSIYTHRSNKPEGGMIGIEAFNIWANSGIALESMVPSDKMSDAEMDAVVIDAHDGVVAERFAVSNSVGLVVGDFDMVASTIQKTGKGVMVWFYFNKAEWSQKYPKIIDHSLNLYDPNTLRHSVTAVDFGLIDGVEYIKIEDSAHFGGLTARWVSREFFEKRNFFSRYPMNFKYEEGEQASTDKPKHTFLKTLVFIPLDSRGNISDPALNEAQKADVIALQDILKYEGFFPKNIASTGYYGSVTSDAVYNFQVQHVDASLSELNSIIPRGGRVGAKTIAALNQLYSI